MLLKTLCETHGVSGDESRVRDILLEAVRPYADRVTVDVMGNLIVYKKGESADKTVMLCAHMDEVGLIVSAITESGYLKFQTVGGIDARVLVGKRVVVGQSNITGIISLKAIHLQTKDERTAAVKEKQLYIDIGAKDKADAERVVSLGDYAAFDTAFGEFGDGCWKAKAFDDRCGCAVLARLIQERCAYDTYFCFTVQEEVGCRGRADCGKPCPAGYGACAGGDDVQRRERRAETPRGDDTRRRRSIFDARPWVVFRCGIDKKTLCDGAGGRRDGAV